MARLMSIGVVVLISLFAAVSSISAQATSSNSHYAQSEQQDESAIVTGSYTGSPSPQYMYTAFAKERSTIVHLDLTKSKTIPPSAVVTGVHINVRTSSGRFARAKIVVFDENGQGFYVHELTRKTEAHNGKPARQRWGVAFVTDEMFDGPARIWPTVTIDFKDGVHTGTAVD